MGNEECIRCGSELTPGDDRLCEMCVIDDCDDAFDNDFNNE